MSPKVYGHRSGFLQYCNKLKYLIIAMAMVMMGYTCVQSFVVMHPTIV